MPDICLESRVTKQWQDIGFQGNNPATDFRGMGVLGLRCLLYPEMVSHNARLHAMTLSPALSHKQFTKAKDETSLGTRLCLFATESLT